MNEINQSNKKQETSKETTAKGLLFMILIKPTDFLPLTNNFTRQLSLLLKTNIQVVKKEDGELMVEEWYEGENEDVGEEVGFRRIHKRSVSHEGALIG